jgi:hypothetical protein
MTNSTKEVLRNLKVAQVAVDKAIHAAVLKTDCDRELRGIDDAIDDLIESLSEEE